MSVSSFEGSEDSSCFVAFRKGLTADTRQVRHRMLKGARAKTQNGFAKHRTFILKNSSQDFIRNFMKEHWKVMNDLSARDRALIVKNRDSIERAVYHGLPSTHHFYD